MASIAYTLIERSYKADKNIADQAQYIKGAAANSIGNLSGFQEWSASGEETKHHAIEAMREAGENHHPNQGFGKVEETLGKGVGV